MRVPEPSILPANGGLSATAARTMLVVLGSLVLLKLLFLVDFSLRSRWVMDEYAQGYSSHLLDDSPYVRVDPIKTLLPELAFHLSLHHGLSSEEIHRSWRLESLAAAVLAVALTAAAARALFGGWLAPSLSAFVLLSFSNFMEHSFRVRNDSFATLFAVAGFAILVAPAVRRFADLGAGFAVGLAFLCTQKAAFHVAALGLGVLFLGWGEGGTRSVLARSARFVAGFGAALVAYALYFGGSDFGEVLRATFLSPLRHSRMLADHSYGLSHYVVQTLVRNPASYLLCGAGLIWAAWRWRAISWRQRGAFVITIAIAVLVFTHRQSWPYLFAMAHPFLAIWTYAVLSALPERFRLSALLIVTTALAFSFVRNVGYLAERSPSQEELVRQAESLLGPNDSYFDGIGMIPTRTIAGAYPWWYWDRPTLARIADAWNRGERQALETILRAQPKVWILNYRLDAFAPILDPILRSATVRTSEFLLVAGCPARSEPTTFRNLWTGSFRLYRISGEPATTSLILDGESCRQPCRVTAGTHTVRIDSPETLFLLPEDWIPHGKVPFDGPFRDLYAGIYDF